MKTLGIISLGTALVLASAASYAQNNSGTAPEHKANTGWTGGSRDQPSQTGQSGQNNAAETSGQAAGSDSARDAEAAKNQPLTATGADLKGPPQRFPPSKTPE